MFPQPRLCRGGGGAEREKIQRQRAEGVEVKRDGAGSCFPGKKSLLALNNLIDQSGRPDVPDEKDPSQIFGVGDIWPPGETASPRCRRPEPGQPGFRSCDSQDMRQPVRLGTKKGRSGKGFRFCKS